MTDIASVRNLFHFQRALAVAISDMTFPK